MRKLGVSLLGVGMILVIWQVSAIWTGNDFFLPPPLKVMKALSVILSEANTYKVLLASFSRLLLSLSLAACFGIVFGLFAGLYPYFDAFLRPFVSGLRTVPVVSLIVVILILYGQSLSIYIIGFLVVFPLLFETTKEGIVTIDSGIKDALLLEPVNLPLKLSKQYVPLALPYIKTGLLQSIGLGFKVLVMSEYIAQTKSSIGRMLYEGRIMMNYEDVFAWTLLIIAIVFVMEIIINKFKPASVS